MAPERMLWGEIDWVRRCASHGAGGLPEHPLPEIDIVMEHDAAEGRRALGGRQR